MTAKTVPESAAGSSRGGKNDGKTNPISAGRDSDPNLARLKMAAICLYLVNFNAVS